MPAPLRPGGEVSDRRRRTAATAVLGLLAVALLSGAARGGVQDDGCTPRASAAYTQRVETALRSARDRWGEELLAAASGPTYAGAAGRLAPLLYAYTPRGPTLTASGVYYVPFGIPGAGGAMLHVADGGQILARRVGGPSLAVLVGSGGKERYGSCLARLTPARLAGGWLPILVTAYRDGAGGRYRQESFAARAVTGMASFVRLTGSAPRSVRLRAGPVSVTVPAGGSRTLFVRWAPPDPPVAISAAAYGRARASVAAYWAARLAAGARIEVPERRVQDAERALLVQNLLLGGRYSIGNAYEKLSFPETVDDARVLGEYGFGDSERAILLGALSAPPSPYPNWQMGSLLLGFASHDERFRDRATLERATPALQGFLSRLERRIGANGLMPRERYSSDVADRVYGLHAQATIWQGLREIAAAWARAGRASLAARAASLAARLGDGIRAALRRSERPLPDGSLFVPMRLLDGVDPYGAVTESREGSYWNLVAPYAFASGILPPSGSRAGGALRYLLLHGGRLLGLVRTAAPVLYGAGAGGVRSGTNAVYGNNASRFLADLDRPDLLDLSLYGQLAAGMTPGTFVAGEAASVAPLGDARHRAMYLPPNAAANATFLETLRLTLVHETQDGLDLAFATPRSWLRAGNRVVVHGLPTRFGPLSFAIDAGARSLHVTVNVPSRTPPKGLRLRLRLPAGQRIGTISPRHPIDRRTQTIDLGGLRGTVEFDVGRAGS